MPVTTPVHQPGGLEFNTLSVERLRARAERFNDERYPVQGLLGIRTAHGWRAFKVNKGAEPAALGLDIMEFLQDMPANELMSIRHMATKIRWRKHDSRIMPPEPAVNMLYWLLDPARYVALPDNSDFLGRLKCDFTYILDFEQLLIEVVVWNTPERQKLYLRTFDDYCLQFLDRLSRSEYEIVTDGPVRRTGWTWQDAEPITGPSGAALFSVFYPRRPFAISGALITLRAPAQPDSGHSASWHCIEPVHGTPGPSGRRAFGSVAMAREASSMGTDGLPFATNVSDSVRAPPPVMVRSRPRALDQSPAHFGRAAIPTFNIPPPPTIPPPQPGSSGQLPAFSGPAVTDRLPTAIGSPRHGLGPYSPEMNYGPIGGRLNQGYESDTDTLFDAPTGAGITANDVWPDEALTAWTLAGPSSGWVAPPPSQQAESSYSVPAVGLQYFAGVDGPFYFSQNEDEYGQTLQIEPFQI